MKTTPNIQYIKEISENDISFQQKLISIIKKEFPKEKAALIKQINLRKYELAGDIVHKLKHKINILGMNEGYFIANNLEIELRQNKQHSFPKLLLVLNAIESFLKQI